MSYRGEVFLKLWYCHRRTARYCCACSSHCAFMGLVNGLAALTSFVDLLDSQSFHGPFSCEYVLDSLLAYPMAASVALVDFPFDPWMLRNANLMEEFSSVAPVVHVRPRSEMFIRFPRPFVPLTVTWLLKIWCVLHSTVVHMGTFS